MAVGRFAAVLQSPPALQSGCISERCAFSFLLSFSHLNVSSCELFLLSWHIVPFLLWQISRYTQLHHCNSIISSILL